MAITRGELKGQVLLVLNKTAKHPGFYGDEKVEMAIQEAIDFVAAEMFLADEGWQTKISFLDTTAGQMMLDLPVGVAMVKEVRYLIGGSYVPMTYNPAWGQAASDPSAAVAQQSGSVYRIVDNCLYFDPPLADGQTRGIMLEHMSYPQRLVDDAQFLESQFDFSMLHFVKYRACSILAASIEKAGRPWADLEASWYDKMLAIVNKRNAQSVAIQEFEG